MCCWSLGGPGRGGGGGGGASRFPPPLHPHAGAGHFTSGASRGQQLVVGAFSAWLQYSWCSRQDQQQRRLLLCALASNRQDDLVRHLCTSRPSEEDRLDRHYEPQPLVRRWHTLSVSSHVVVRRPSCAGLLSWLACCKLRVCL